MRRREALTVLAAGLVAACGGGGGGGTAAGGGGGRSVLSVARSAGLDRFVRAVDAAGMTELLSASGPYTLFAPTDRAFAASNANRLDGEALQALVAYHVVPGTLTTDFLDGIDINHTTLLGSRLNTDGTGGALRVNDANVVRADLMAGNGVVFAIDRVLTPVPPPRR
jgi:uncharacterized surface protein with fasciclin (FAS1) repeats